MAPHWGWRGCERTLPIGHISLAQQVAAEQVGLDRGNAEALRSKRERCADASILHRQLAVRPFDVFGLHGSLGGKILQVPGAFALELRRTFAKLRLPRQGRELAEIRHAVIITAQLRIVKVLQLSREVNFRFSGSHRQTADVGASASQNHRSIRPPRKRGILLETRGDASREYPRFVLPAQQGVVQKQRQVLGGKIERHFLVFPQQFAPLHLDARNRERDEFLDRSPVRGKAGWRRGNVGGAIGIDNHMDDGMIEHQRMQSDGGAEDGNDFHFRLQAVDPHIWHLIRSFATVDSQVASVHAQAERDSVKFSEFDASAGDFLHRRDHAAADQLLKGIGSDVPAEQGECKQAENTKRQKEFPQDAPARGRNRPGQRFDQRLSRGFGRRFGHGCVQRLRSPALDSGVRIWLPERRLASQPESSSFIFRSASKSLIWP